MSKILECAKVDPSSGCQFVVRGETVEEVLRKASEHAREHGIWEVTPKFLEQIKVKIYEAQFPGGIVRGRKNLTSTLDLSEVRGLNPIVSFILKL